MTYDLETEKEVSLQVSLTTLKTKMSSVQSEIKSGGSDYQWQ